MSRLEEIRTALEAYDESVKRKVEIMTKSARGEAISGKELEHIVDGYEADKSKFIQAAPQHLHLLLPVVEAAMAMEKLQNEIIGAMTTEQTNKSLLLFDLYKQALKALTANSQT